MRSLFLFVVALSCIRSLAAQETDNPKPPSDETSTMRYPEFHQMTEQWKEAYNSKDAKNFLPFYAENAQYISSHVPGYEANGRENVLANFQRGMTQGGYIDSIKVLSVDVSCDIASMVTVYYATNSGIHVSGRNLIVFKKIEGKWRILRHMTAVQD